MPKIGAHVSARGGVSNAPRNAMQEGCEVFQFFLAPPQSYAMPELSEAEIARFKSNCAAGGFTEYYVHASYLINLASLNPRIRYGSIALLRKGLERASLLGVRGMMFHTGSGSGHPSKTAALKKAINSINKIVDGYTGSTKLLIENAAGAGGTLGVHFTEIGKMLAGVNNKTTIGVCLDTQHAFASGYDWRTTSGTTKALVEFSRVIGMRRLTVIQANDSPYACGANKDRHAHIGDGEIGTQGFYNLLHHPKLRTKAFILETEPDKRTADIALLKKLRA